MTSRSKAAKPSRSILEPPPSPKPDSRRKHRARPTPSWLLEQQDLDEIAKRRCLMVLSVLSGETPVTDAITTSQISRGTYYQLEERALRAMLRALTPGAETVATADPAAPSLRRVGELETRVRTLEADKRRLEHLLSMTKKVLRPGPMKMGTGRPSKRLVSSIGGPRPSPCSTSSTSAPTPKEASTPKPDGEGAP